MLPRFPHTPDVQEIQVAQLAPSTMMPNGKISPIAPERVVEDVKNIEEIRRHPPCEMLEA